MEAVLSTSLSEHTLPPSRSGRRRDDELQVRINKAVYDTYARHSLSSLWYTSHSNSLLRSLRAVVPVLAPSFRPSLLSLPRLWNFFPFTVVFLSYKRPLLCFHPNPFLSLPHVSLAPPSRQFLTLHPVVWSYSPPTPCPSLFLPLPEAPSHPTLNRTCTDPLSFFCRVTVSSHEWWLWPVAWQPWQCRRRTGWPAEWEAGSLLQERQAPKAPPYGTPPAVARHWKPTGGENSGLHPVLVAADRWKQSKKKKEKRRCRCRWETQCEK